MVDVLLLLLPLRCAHIVSMFSTVSVIFTIHYSAVVVTVSVVGTTMVIVQSIGLCVMCRVTARTVQGGLVRVQRKKGSMHRLLGRTAILSRAVGGCLTGLITQFMQRSCHRLPVATIGVSIMAASK